VPSCTLTYPELRWTVDLRNDVIEPTTGFYATASISHTLKPGSFNYLRFAPEIRGYVPVVPGLMVLALRAQYGALVLQGGDTASPFTQRFFAGGQNSNRGFGANGQGPQVGAEPNTIPGPLGLAPMGFATIAIPIGGNGFSLASAELRIHTDFILAHTAVVPFVDASSVTTSAALPFRDMLEYAPGLGLRYTTPFGPVRLDVAFLANPIDQTTDSPSPAELPTVYSVHCHHDGVSCILESRVQYHLSIGEAF
jgi:translocation and assembly module TamA